MAGACNTLNSHCSKEGGGVDNPDSIETHYIYSDSVDDIIMKPTTVRLYQMPTPIKDTIDTTEMDSLLVFPIEKKHGKLSKKEKELLAFVIGDEKQYRRNYAPIRQPFIPIFALEFIKNNQCAYYFVSLGTGEVAIADSKGKLQFYLVKDANMIERWYDYVLLEKTKNDKR